MPDDDELEVPQASDSVGYKTESSSKLRNVYDVILRDFDVHVSAEIILRRVVQAHATHRFREFVAAVEGTLSGQVVRKVSEDALPSPLESAAETAAVLASARKRAAAESDALGNADRLLELNYSTLSCTVLVAGHVFVYVLDAYYRLLLVPFSNQ